MTGLHDTWLAQLRRAGQRLGEHEILNPFREARLLLAEVLGVDAAGVIACENEAPKVIDVERFLDLCQQRMDGMPLSRLRGWKEFYGRKFLVDAHVLDPRPETEHLIEEALKRLPTNGRVLDLGVGSGVIVLTLLAERPDTTGVGVDLSSSALHTATRNAHALGVVDRVRWVEGSWDAVDGPFDLVASNPPYIPSLDVEDLAPEVRNHDPRLALDGGADGLNAYRAISARLPGLLRKGGYVVLEVGAGQAEAVSAYLCDAGLENLTVVNDLSGHGRVVIGMKSVD